MLSGPLHTLYRMCGMVYLAFKAMTNGEPAWILR